MKKYSLLFAALFVNYCFALAQTGKPIRVKAGEDVAQAYSSHGFYRFPQFGKATLFFKNGGQNGATVFNYNVLSGNMQFVGPKGDTLDLGGANTIDSIVFEKNMFLFNEGYMEVVATVDSVKLAKKTVVKTQLENIGAYGLPNSTSSITNIKSFTSNSGVYNLIINQDVLLIENISWFFTTGGNNVPVKASKSNLLKLLSPEKQKAAEAYLKQNKTNFEREADLKKLMDAVASAK